MTATACYSGLLVADCLLTASERVHTQPSHFVTPCQTPGRTAPSLSFVSLVMCAAVCVCVHTHLHRYNHYAGRLGIRMPETAALLSRYPLEHYEFHWGATTLTHADTAYQLWRPGLGTPSLCV